MFHPFTGRCGAGCVLRLFNEFPRREDVCDTVDLEARPAVAGRGLVACAEIDVRELPFRRTGVDKASCVTWDKALSTTRDGCPYGSAVLATASRVPSVLMRTSGSLIAWTYLQGSRVAN